MLVSFADTETHPDHVAPCAVRMQERQVEGIAVLTFGMEQYLTGSSIDIPMIYAGNDSALPGIRNVHINYLPGMREAVKHLVDFGHQRIGYLCRPTQLEQHAHPLRRRPKGDQRSRTSAGQGAVCRLPSYLGRRRNRHRRFVKPAQASHSQSCVATTLQLSAR